MVRRLTIGHVFAHPDINFSKIALPASHRNCTTILVLQDPIVRASALSLWAGGLFE